VSNKNQSASSSEEEMEALRSENEALRVQLDERPTRGPLWRRILAGVLAVLAIVAVVAAVQAVWVKTTLQDEDRFVATLQSLPQNDAVASVLSIRVADGVVEAAGVEGFVSDALPDELAFLTSPMTGAIEDLIARVANEVIQSDVVTSAWTATLRVTHKAVSAVLTGNDGGLIAAEGKVGVDLDQIAAVVVDRVEATGLNLPDLDVSLGQVVIYEDDDLAAAQAVAQGIDTMGWFLPVLALVLIAGAVSASPSNRRMTQFLGFGTALGLLLSLAALRIGRSGTISGRDDAIGQEAAGAVWDTLFRPMVQSTWAVMLLALIVGLFAWATGPSERAGRVGAWASRTLDSWRRPGEEQPSGFTAFLVEWKRTVQVVVVVLGLLFVLFGPAPSGLLVIITTALVLGIVVLVELLAGPAKAPKDELDGAGL
jgi:hypothetical protein